MSNISTQNLIKSRIQELLLAVGEPPAEDMSVNATEYNWNEPHCFNIKQTKKLEDFTKISEEIIAGKITELCRSIFDVKIDSTKQQFADQFLEEAAKSENTNYYLAFNTGKDNRCGFIGIPIETATSWTSHLLGDTESQKNVDTESKEAPGKRLSQLEESLLVDIASVVIKGFSDSHISFNFQPVDTIAKEQIPLTLEGTEQLCKFDLKVKELNTEETSAYILTFADMLEPVVGKADASTGEAAKYSQEDVSNAIIERFKLMAVNTVAELGKTVLTFGELMTLQPDDILLLERKTDEPINLVVEGMKLFKGQPAKSAGRHALVIEEISQEIE